MISRDRTCGVRGKEEWTTNPGTTHLPETSLNVRFQTTHNQGKLTGDGRPTRPSALSSLPGSPDAILRLVTGVLKKARACK